MRWAVAIAGKRGAQSADEGHGTTNSTLVAPGVSETNGRSKTDIITVSRSKCFVTSVQHFCSLFLVFRSVFLTLLSVSFPGFYSAYRAPAKTQELEVRRV